MAMSKKAYFGLGNVPVGIGAVLHGQDITEQEFREKGMFVAGFRAMTEACPHKCLHCFTQRRQRTLTLKEIERVVYEIAELGAIAIAFLGEGEPTVDPDFFPIVECASSAGLIPIVFTEAAAKLRDRGFVKRLKAVGVSVVPKCDSLFNPDYQNWIVGDKTGRYFGERNEAIRLLIDEGFNEIKSDGTTRLGFDMVISSRNIGEVAETLRFCRKNNIRIAFSFFLPVGGSGSSSFDRELEPSVVARQNLRQTIQTIDRNEFGFEHPIWNNFVAVPCVERIQIYGNGQVSPCSAKETIVGTVQQSSLSELHQAILDRFPQHNPSCFDGHCLYRPRI